MKKSRFSEEQIIGVLTKEQRQWYAEHGTAQEKAFVRRYGKTNVTTKGLGLSLGWYAVLFFCMIFLPMCIILYVGRLRTMHPVTGTWVGILTNGTGQAYRRAVYLNTYINPLQWQRPTLAGQVVMCDDGGGMRFSMKRVPSAATYSASFFPPAVRRRAANCSRCSNMWSSMRDTTALSRTSPVTVQFTDGGVRDLSYADDMKGKPQAVLAINHFLGKD